MRSAGHSACRHGVSEGNGECVGPIGRRDATPPHVFLPLKLDFVSRIESIRRANELISEVVVVLDGAADKPSSHCSPDFGAFVCVSLSLRDEIGAVRLAAELDAKHKKSQL